METITKKKNKPQIEKRPISARTKTITSEELELLKEVKKQLPHGALTALSARLKIDVSVLSSFFSGKSSSMKTEILNATAEYLKEYKAKEADAIQAIKNVLNPESPEQLKERLKEQSEKYGDSKSPLLP